MFRKIYLDDPNIGEMEKKFLIKAVDSGFISTIGPFVSEFEEKFVEYLSVNKAVSIQSGTAAIHIALYELGIGEGDEVIVPALTFVATVNPVIYVGATPVFVDVDIKTWNIDPLKIENAITEKTKAIIPVHLYGNPCDMGEIMKLAQKYNLFVVEDATESLGAKFNERFTGTIGTLGCFSFNGNKTITTGGGGMVVGSDEQRLAHIKFLVNQARDDSKGYYHPEVGFNYRMTNIASALGMAQMERLKELLAKKKILNMIYRNELTGVEGLSFQEEYKGAESSCWFTSCLLRSETDMLSLQKRLYQRGIPTRRVFMPIAEFPPYRKARRDELRNTYAIYGRGLCLASSTLNTEEQIYRACEIIKEAVL